MMNQIFIRNQTCITTSRFTFLLKLPEASGNTTDLYSEKPLLGKQGQLTIHSIILFPVVFSDLREKPSTGLFLLLMTVCLQYKIEFKLPAKYNLFHCSLSSHLLQNRLATAGPSLHGISKLQQLHEGLKKTMLQKNSDCLTSCKIHQISSKATSNIHDFSTLGSSYDCPFL